MNRRNNHEVQRAAGCSGVFGHSLAGPVYGGGGILEDMLLSDRGRNQSC